MFPKTSRSTTEERKALTDQVGRAIVPLLHGRRLVRIVLFLGLITSVLVWQIADHVLSSKYQELFKIESELKLREITDALQNFQTLTQAGDAIVESAADSKIDASTWSKFVKSFDIERNYVPIRQLGFARAVHAAGPNVVLPNSKTTAEPSFIQQAIIELLEPLKKQAKDLHNIDLYANPKIKAALNQSILTGEAAFVPRVDLPGYFEPQMMIFVPIYDRNLSRATPEQWIAALRGFSFSILDTQEFMRQVLKIRQGGMDIHFYDSGNEDPKALIHQENTVAAPTYQQPFRYQGNIVFGGRTLTVVLHADSTYIPSAEKIQPVLFGLGSVVTTLMLFLYLTTLPRQKENAEQRADEMNVELAARKEELNSIMQLASDSIIVIDQRGEILEINPEGQKFFGYTPDELIGRNVGMLMTSPYLENHDDDIARYLITDEGHVIGTGRDVDGIHKNGSILPFHLRFSERINPDGDRHFIGFLRDKTDEKQRLKAEAQFESLFKVNSSALLVVDDQGNIVMVNPAFERIFHYTSEEILNQPVEVLMPEHYRSHYLELRTAYFKQPRAKNMGVGRDLFGRRKDDSTFPIEVGLSPYQENGQLFVLAMIVDISERKRAQDAILRMNEELEQRVTERTAELQAARQEAESMANAKGNFLANMSHEIRTQMNAILGLAYLLEKADLNAKELYLVKKIRIAGHSLLGITNDILDFSKIESGRLSIEHEPFQLNDVLENVSTLMALNNYHPDVELIVGSAPIGAEYILGDALCLEQVLANLTNNALRFTERGYVALAVMRLPPSSHEDCEFLRFSVKDTGIGIAPNKQAEIFSAFSPEGISTTRRFGGTGLDLTICRRLVELMGGEIGVNSELGKGSEFWFTLRLETAEPSTSSVPEMTHQTALIADDHPLAREVLAATAGSLGWQVDVVDSGEEAVNRAVECFYNSKPPDLLILDWRMPGMDGLETARRIKEIMADTPIVVMVTAHDRDTFIAQREAEVADVILNKPVTASALYNAVAAIKQRTTVKKPGVANVIKEQRLCSLRVLLVDDSESNLEVAARILESEGATVHTVEDGQMALKWLRDHACAVDVVLMDVQMPVMDGYEATQRIRETLGLTAPPIFALTASALNSQEEATQASGMDGFITKPFDAEQMIVFLQRYMPDPANADVLPSAQEYRERNVSGAAYVPPGVAMGPGVLSELERQRRRRQNAWHPDTASSQWGRQWRTAYRWGVVRRDGHWMNVGSRRQSSPANFSPLKLDEPDFSFREKYWHTCKAPVPPSSTGVNLAPTETSEVVLDQERGLRNWGNATIYHKYLVMFADNHGKDGDILDQLLVEGKKDQARALAHKLKGVAGNLTLMAVAKRAGNIEHILATGGDTGNEPKALQLALDRAAQEIASITQG